MEVGIQASHPLCSSRNGSLECHNSPSPLVPSMESTTSGLPCRQRWKWSTRILLSPCHCNNDLTPHARKSWILQDLGLSCRQDQPEISWNVVIPNRNEQIMQRHRNHPLGCCYKLIFPEFWDFSRLVVSLLHPAVWNECQ